MNVRMFYKMLQKHLWNRFLICLLVEILQLVHEISSFPEVLCKRGVLKNFSKYTDKRKKQSSARCSIKRFCSIEKFCKIYRKTSLPESLFLVMMQTTWKSETVRSSHWRCSVKKVIKLFQ